MILNLLKEDKQLTEEVTGNGIEKIGEDIHIGDAVFNLYHITERSALDEFELFNNNQ